MSAKKNTALPFLPSSVRPSEIADFAEMECLRREEGNVSINFLARAIARGSVEPADMESDGEAENLEGSIEDETTSFEENSENEEDGEYAPESANEQRKREDRLRQRILESLEDANARGKHCGRGVFYPFRLRDKNGEVLEWIRPITPKRQQQSCLYFFLLFATIATDGEAAGIFERLCRRIALNYWGGGRADALVFSQIRSFKNKIEALAKQLGEGGGFRAGSISRGRSPQDDGLDIVVHRRFADGRAGQLIGFGQCKTGQRYERKDLTELQPSVFDGYLQNTLTVSPVRLFFLSDRIVEDEDIAINCRRAGVLFDRCRIMEYATKIEPELREEIVAWTRRIWKKKNLGAFPFRQ